MNVFEMLSFDFMEFITSTEGIFIIVGILLLIVGVVMLAMEKGKNKDNTVAVSAQDANNVPPVVETTNDAVMPTVEPVIVPTVTETPVMPTVEPVIVPTVTETPVMPAVEPVVVPATTEVPVEPVIVPTVTETPVMPVVEPVVVPATTEVPVESVIAPTVTETPVMPTVEPIVTPTVTEAPVMPTVEQLTTPVVEPVIVNNNVEPTVAPVEKIEEPVTVYGGASPEVTSKEILEEKPREIYGGANPLENTAPIPTQSVNAAYSATSAPIPEVQVTPAPVVESLVPSTDTPVVSNVEPVNVTAEQPKEEIEKLEF